MLANQPTTFPSLNLDFINTQVLDPRISFSRNSTATRFNSVGILEVVGNNQPRFDYDPVTLTQSGLLIEESRTNSIRNNTMVGAVAGTPGTLPTNWFVFTVATGLTTSVVGTGTENGINYADVRLNGTAAGGTNIIWGLEGNTSVAAANAQIWTESSYLKLQAGSLAGITDIRLQNDERTATTYIRSNFSSALAVTSAALNTQRFSFVSTLSGGATVAFIVPYVIINFSTGVAIDITLRIGMPQLELGGFATSVIPTSTGTVSRAADTASIDTLTPWYNPTEGTLFAESSVNYAIPATVFPIVASLNDNTVNNRIDIGYVTSNVAGFEIVAGGVVQSTMYPANARIVRKNAGAYSANNFAISTSGSVASTNSTGSVPTVTRLGIGSRTTGYSAIHVRRIAFYQSRLSNTQIQVMTSS